MFVAVRSSALLCRRFQQRVLRIQVAEAFHVQSTTAFHVQSTTATSPSQAVRRYSGSSVRGDSSSSSRTGGYSSSSGKWDFGHFPLAPGTYMLLVVALTWSTSTRPPAEAGWWPFSRGPASPFDNTVPRSAKRQRAKAEEEMRKYLLKMRFAVQELMVGLRTGEVTRDEYDQQMASLNNEVELATHRIIYGDLDPPDSRRVFEADYGKCRCTPDATRALAALSPLIEINADRGHWQRALSEAGATVVAFDRWATNPGSSKLGTTAGMPQVGKVLPGDEHAIRLHRDKTLLLVYPPPGDTAVRCLREYQGDALAYVGEGRGGINADDAFFESLDADWEVTSIVDLDPFPQCFERLYLLRRRRRNKEVLSSSTKEAGDGGSLGNSS